MGIEEMDELEDADSTDILTEISRGTDKWLWFVEAHQQDTPELVPRRTVASLGAVRCTLVATPALA